MSVELPLLYTKDCAHFDGNIMVLPSKRNRPFRLGSCRNRISCGLAGLAVIVLCVVARRNLNVETGDLSGLLDFDTSLLRDEIGDEYIVPAAEVKESKPVATEKSHVTPGGTISFRRSDFPGEPPSLYEERTPHYNLPEWAKKPFFFRVPIPKDKQVCFVHIGKTAGSTVGCSLGFQLHCNGIVAKYPKWLLPKYTSNTVHNGVNDCPYDAAYYLFVMRNPLERLKSAYVYDRPAKVVGPDHWTAKHGRFYLYFDCPFFTLNELAENGLAEDGKASDVCKERAYKAVRGSKRFGYHLFFNYDWYTSRTVSDETKKIIALRTEHLEEDWISAEHTVGGTNDEVHFPIYNKGSAKDDKDSYLSPKAIDLLCKTLCDEIQVYKKLLSRAVNLTPEQLQTSRKELADSCPREAELSLCPAS